MRGSASGGFRKYNVSTAKNAAVWIRLDHRRYRACGNRCSATPCTPSSSRKTNPEASGITIQKAAKSRTASSTPDAPGTIKNGQTSPVKQFTAATASPTAAPSAASFAPNNAGVRTGMAHRIMQSRRSGNNASQSSSVNTPMIAIEVEIRNSWSAHAAAWSCFGVRC